MENVIVKFTGESDFSEVENDFLVLKEKEKELTAEMKRQQLEYSKSIKAIKDQVKGEELQAKAIKKVTDEHRKKTNELKSDLNTTKKTIKDLDSQMKSLDDTVASGVINKSFRSQIREVREEMARMKLAGEDTGETYEMLKQKLGEMVDTMADVGAEGRRMGSDTRGFDTLLEGAQVVSGGFAVAQGAMALAGEAGKEFEEVMVKLQAAIAITTGLQSIGNAVQKESNLMLAIGTFQKSMLVRAENLDTAAKSKNIIVSKGATAAQWAMNAAANANPYVLLATAIITVVGALYLFTVANKDASKSIKAQVASDEVWMEYLEIVTNRLNENRDAQIKNTETTLELAKAQGKSANELAAMEETLLRQKASRANSVRGFYAQELYDLEANKTKVMELTSSIMNAKKVADDEVTLMINGEFKTIDLEAAQGLLDSYQSKVDLALKVKLDAEEAVQELKEFEAAEAVRRKKLAIDDAIAAAKSRVEIARKFSGEEMQAKIDLIKAERVAALNDVNLTENQRKLIIIQSDKSILEAKREQRDNELQLDMDLQEAKLLNAEEGSLQELELRIDMLNTKAKIELNAADITEAKKLLIIEQNLKAINDLEKKYAFDRRKSVLNTDLSMLNAELSGLESWSKQKYQIQSDIVIKESELQKVAARESIKNKEELSAKLLEIDAATAAKIREIMRQSRAQELEEQTALNDAIYAEKVRQLDIDTVGVKSNYSTKKKYWDLEVEEINRLNQEAEQAYDDDIISYTDYLAKKEALRNRAHKVTMDQQELEKEAYKEAANTLLNSFIEVTEALNQKEQARIQQQLEDLNNYYTTDIEAARANAELKYVSKKELDKKERELKRQAAEAEQDAAVFQATLNGLIAITKTFASYGFTPAGLIAVAAQGIATGIQINAIKSSPLPAYWKGKKPQEGKGSGQFSKVGEYGPEVMWIPDNAAIVPAHASRDMASTIQHLASIGVPVGISRNSKGGIDIDYNKLGKAVADNVKIPEQKAITVHIDRDGITTRDSGNITTVMNNYYTMRS